jgi:hypothetical protein
VYLRRVQVLLILWPLAGCTPSRTSAAPTIEFTKVPIFGEGSSDKLYPVEGRATGVRAGQKIVLYAKSGDWWVQPTKAEPFTAVGTDSAWKNRTHPGVAYAALLVEAGYFPNAKLGELPEKGSGILATAVVESKGTPAGPGKSLFFGGYEWRVRDTPFQPGGSQNDYDSANAWTDRNGHLHLRISGYPGHWASAEVTLSRSLGYGSYRFVVRELSHFEPSVVLSMMISDSSAPSREMDIEISKWGETTGRNGQFVIQPYYVPANTVQFEVPAGRATFMLRWSPGRAEFKAFKGSAVWDSPPVREHPFTSGVPPPGTESVHLNLYVFGLNRNPLRQKCEVVVESFEYLP